MHLNVSINRVAMPANLDNSEFLIDFSLLNEELNQKDVFDRYI